MFNRSSSIDSTVVGKARPEGADDEVERVLFEGKGMRLAMVEGVGHKGRTGTIMVGSRLMGVGVAGFVVAVGGRADAISPVCCCASMSDKGI